LLPDKSGVSMGCSESAAVRRDFEQKQMENKVSDERLKVES
jgi:hypothetical protein